jgi:hypothetical protein
MPSRNSAILGGCARSAVMHAGPLSWLQASLESTGAFPSPEILHLLDTGSPRISHT